jgi:acylphosphatase
VKKIRVHLLIKGRVQGVFFRAETRREAIQLGVKGWVRNRWGGEVEAVFEGEEEAVKRMIAWCHKGPPAALVEEVEEGWEKFRGEFDTFSVRY